MGDVDVFQLVRLGKLDDFRYVADSVDINQCDEWGGNLLHQAIGYESSPFVAELIRKGIDVNHQNEDGDTPLHYAAELRNLVAATSIIDAGGDVNICNRHGNSPLWTAIFNARGEFDIIELFLNHRADPRHKNMYGLSPIDLARLKRDPVLISMLEAVA